MARSFKNRLLILIVGLVLIGQGVTVVLALAYLQRNVRQEAAGRLELTSNSLTELLQERAERLRAAAGVLVRDYGFLTAATADPATARSALQSHAGRINADLALLYDNGGRLIASSAELPQGFTMSVSEDDQRQQGWSFAIVGERAVQVVSAPVRAPDVIGRVVLGFTLDQSLVRKLGQQTGTEVSIVGQARGPGSSFSVSTLAATAAGQLTTLDLHPLEAATTSEVELAHARYLTLARPLPVLGGHLWLVAQRPEDDVLDQYRQMRYALLGIVALTIAIAATLAWLTGRNAVRPLSQLVDAAERIRRGDYAAPVAAGEVREFAQLADTFNDMQAGIREREARIVFGSRHDTLTGLPNRQALRELLPQSFAGAPEAALLLVDVCRFRDINASVGHATGDELLQALAARLLYLAGANGVCARLGADQFAVGATGAASSLLHRFLVLAEELRHGLAAGELRVPLDLRAGVVPWSPREDSIELLLRRADSALLQAKESGDTAIVYQSSSDAEQQRRIVLVAELRGAIARHELHLVFQPMVRMTDRQPENYEALLRWTHPRLGPISPAEFIPLAERASLMGPLSQLVLELAIGQLGEWQRAGFTPLVSVNLSATDMADGELCARVLGLLRRHDVPATQLLLEVTETAIMRDAQQARQIMHQLRMAGVRFAVDDFGTGHSSLAQLQRLPVDELKIDRSFVDGIENSSGSQAIVRAATELAHSLGLRVVAEGVETAASWSVLLRLGADVAQGYLISRPMPAADLPAWSARYLASLDESVNEAERDGRIAALRPASGPAAS